MQEGCINLKERFGRRYRVRQEESYLAQYGDKARRPDPWLLLIPCKYGHIYPFGGNLLAASIDGFPEVAGRLRNLDCCRVHQDGDCGELTVIVNAADLPKVAKIIRPRLRRRLSDRQRAELAKRLAANRQDTPQARTQGRHTAQERDAGRPGDSEAAESQLALF